MKIIAGIALVVILALLGSRWTFTRVRIPLAARHIYLTGTEYIFVGMGLGSLLIGLLDAPTLQGLQPLLSLALGWVGLLFGMQLEFPQISRFPQQYFYFALLQALLTGVVCFFPLLFLLGLTPLTTGSLTLLSAFALSTMAMPTAQSSLALLQQELNLQRHKIMELLRYTAAIDALVALVIFGYLFCLPDRASWTTIHLSGSLFYFFLSLFLGCLMGFLLHLLTKIHCSEEELLLFTVGIVAFSSGMAVFLRLSPLFVTLVGGVLLTNVHGAKLRIIRVLHRLEKPVYIVLLLLAGAMVRPDRAGWWSWGLALVYLVLRGLGKWLGAALACRWLLMPFSMPSSVGLGLISQGGMAVAMVLSFHQLFHGSWADTILLVMLVGIIINELFSPSLAQRLVQREL